MSSSAPKPEHTQPEVQQQLDHHLNQIDLAWTALAHLLERRTPFTDPGNGEAAETAAVVGDAIRSLVLVIEVARSTLEEVAFHAALNSTSPLHSSSDH